MEAAVATSLCILSPWLRYIFLCGTVNRGAAPQAEVWGLLSSMLSAGWAEFQLTAEQKGLCGCL